MRVCEWAFTVPGLPRICGGFAAPSPSRGSLRKPDRSATVPSQKSLQEPSRLVLDFDPIPPAPSFLAPAWNHQSAGARESAGKAQVPPDRGSDRSGALPPSLPPVRPSVPCCMRCYRHRCRHQAGLRCFGGRPQRPRPNVCAAFCQRFPAASGACGRGIPVQVCPADWALPLGLPAPLKCGRPLPRGNGLLFSCLRWGWVLRASNGAQPPHFGTACAETSCSRKGIFRPLEPILAPTGFGFGARVSESQRVPSSAVWGTGITKCWGGRGCGRPTVYACAYDVHTYMCPMALTAAMK